MILIVDDRPENILSLKSILELNKFEVDTALSGEEALKKVLKNNYALIILDVQMPGMDGFEVAEAITGFNKTRDIPIIFLSAVNTHKKFVTKGFESGGIDYITKPVDPDILILKVRTFFRLYKQTQELNQAHQSLKKEVEVRKEAEKALSNTVEELHSTLESIPQIAFTAQPDGGIDFVNKQWFRFSDNINSFPESHPDDVDILNEWKHSIKSEVPLELEVRIKEKISGNYCYYLLRTTPVIAKGIIVKWVGTFTDINEQKLVNEILEQRVEDRTKELMETNRQLESSNHDLQQFASVASHDLKEPLRKIQFFSNMIKDQFSLEEGMAKYLDKVIYSSQRMSLLIHDLLSFTRLSIADVFQVADINVIINEILGDLELSINQKGAEITVDPLPKLEVVPGLIRQLFQNLISNALKFSKAGQKPVIKIYGELVDDLSADSMTNISGSYCRIAVSDNGIGFDQKYEQKMFTIFQRLNSREEYEGTGIGLAIAKKIIEKHHGIITARSKPGEGATFILVLPVRQSLVAKQKQANTSPITLY